MKVISFFSRITIICNIAFVIFIVLGRMEAKKPVTREKDIVIAVSFFKDIIITLGVAAILINLVMCLVYAIILITARHYLLPKWMAIANALFLVFQFVYFFYR